jgi:hypothetical protein
MTHLYMLFIFHVNVIICQFFNLSHIHQIFVETNHFLGWKISNYSHGIQNMCKFCEMTWFNIPSTFIKTRNHFFFRVYLCFWINMYITFVFTNILQSPTLWNEMKFLFLISFLGYILTKYAKLLWNCFKSLRWHKLKHAHP